MADTPNTNLDHIDAGIPECECPWCGVEMNALMRGDDKGVAPEPGHPAICVECINLCIIDDDLTVRKPKAGDVPSGWLPGIAEAKMKLQDMKLRRDQDAAAN